MFITKSGNWPIVIYEDVFIDKNISLEAKALVGILNTHKIGSQNIHKFL